MYRWWRSNRSRCRAELVSSIQLNNNPVNQTVDFYFDFSSPYGYFSSEKVEEMAGRSGATIVWRPYLMGVAFRLTQRKPLFQIPMVKDYSARDLDRVARFDGTPFNVPSPFPVATVVACRAYYWLSNQDPLTAKEFAKKLFRAYFINNKPISEIDVVVEIASQVDVDAEELNKALLDPDVKRLARTATDDAINKGVFGSPFFIVDGEPFWGHDRLPHVEAWVTSGGW